MSDAHHDEVQPGPKRNLGPWIFASALVVIVGGFALVFALPQLRDRSSRQTIERMIATGRTSEAVAASRALRARRPDDPALIALLDRAVQADLQRYVQDGRYEEAYAALDRYESELSYLPEISERRLEIAKHEIDTLSRAQPREAWRRAEELLEGREEPEVLLYLARVATVEGTNVDSRYVLDLYIRVMEKDASLVEGSDEASQTAKRALARLTPRDGADEQRQWVSRTLYDELRPWLLEAVHDKGSKNTRRNAWLILRDHDSLAEVDEFKFHTLELTQLRTTDSYFSKFVFEYFDGLIDENGTVAPRTAARARLIRELADEKSTYGLLYFNDMSRSARRVVGAIFANDLKDEIMAWCTGDVDARRVYAYQIAADRGWTTADDEFAYHLKNLQRYDSRYAAPWMLESVEYFGSRQDRERASVALDSLKTIAERAKDMEEHWRQQGNAQDAELFERLKVAAEKALLHLT